MIEKDLLEQYETSIFKEREQRVSEVAEMTANIPEDELKRRIAKGGMNAIKAANNWLAKHYPGLGYYEASCLAETEAFHFEKVEKFLTNIPDIPSKLRFLYDVKAKFERFEIKSKGVKRARIVDDDVYQFGKYCQLEIEKYEKLLRLDEFQQTNSEETKKGKRSKGETLDRTCLFFYFLLDYLQVKCKANKRAKILSDLTGFSENTIEDFLRHHNKKATENFTNYEKDIDYVRNAFNQFNLNQIEKMVANDLAETISELPEEK
jgi:hypothetical protein